MNATCILPDRPRNTWPEPLPYAPTLDEVRTLVAEIQTAWQRTRFPLVACAPNLHRIALDHWNSYGGVRGAAPFHEHVAHLEREILAWAARQACIPPSPEAPDVKSVREALAGIVYDFAAYLTTRPGNLVAGSSHDSAPMAEACKAFLNLRGLDDVAPRVFWEHTTDALPAKTQGSSARPHYEVGAVVLGYVGNVATWRRPSSAGQIQSSPMLTIQMCSSTDEGTHTPAESVTLVGDVALRALRAAIDEALKEPNNG